MKHMFAIVVGGSLSACALFTPTLVDQRIVSLDLKKTAPVSIIGVMVYEDAGNMIVRGEAKYPISNRYGKFYGHVDVTVVEPDGRKFENHNVKVVPRRIPKTMGREAFFTTDFPIDPLRGTKVSIAYNESNH